MRQPIKLFINLVYFLSVLSFVFLLQSCDGFSWLPKEEVEEDNSTKIKDGLVKTKRDDGSLYSEINYVKGIKHGLSKSYTKKGKLQFEIPYDSGRKHGIAKMFYEDGKVRRETEYVYGKKSGQRKSYWTSGTISSSITYKDDMPATDLKEFMKSGKEKSGFEKLEFEVVDQLNSTGDYIVKVKFSKNHKRGDYFIGELVDGKYFNEHEAEELPEENGVGILMFSPPPGVFVMKKINIIGKLKTARGNPLIRQKVFNLAIERPF